mmetsp:Transcript_15895/g.31664  ORF Transcript_15895/g.31664 Transcript_15895/m.31664 type:complete len:266 (-) Transcript_15895:648-1445(-)
MDRWPISDRMTSLTSNGRTGGSSAISRRGPSPSCLPTNTSRERTPTNAAQRKNCALPPGVTGCCGGRSSRCMYASSTTSAPRSTYQTTSRSCPPSRSPSRTWTTACGRRSTTGYSRCSTTWRTIRCRPYSSTGLVWTTVRSGTTNGSRCPYASRTRDRWWRSTGSCPSSRRRGCANPGSRWIVLSGCSCRERRSPSRSPSPWTTRRRGRSTARRTYSMTSSSSASRTGGTSTSRSVQTTPAPVSAWVSRSSSPTRSPSAPCLSTP